MYSEKKSLNFSFNFKRVLTVANLTYYGRSYINYFLSEKLF